jgi:hypothetical protein
MRRLAILAALVAGALIPPTAVQAFVATGTEHALELSVNGTFEEELATGWQVTLPDTGSTIARETGFDPDPDHEVQVLKVRITGTTGIDQILPLPSLDMQFSVRARVLAEAGAVSWAAAGVILGYIDEGGLTLGQTAICAKSRNCPWESGPTFHVIEALHSDWDTYSFDLEGELATNLAAVDRSAVRRLKISIVSVLDDC